jgi:cytochrome P450
VVPSAASRPADVVLPRSQTMWMLEQPDKVLSSQAAHNDVLYSLYNFLGRRYSDDVWHVKVIQRCLARYLNALIPGVQEDVEHSVDLVFGTDTENWTKLNLWASWLGIVPRVTNRMLVGFPTSRNEQFLASMVSYTDAVVRNCFLLNLIPRISHPVLGWLFAAPNWWHWRKSTRYTIPIIKQRLHDMERKEAGDPAYENWVEPEDFFTWNIRMSKAEGNTIELDPYIMSKRILPLEFAAIHTTVLTGHNVILDLVASDPSLGFIEGIREEAARVLKEEGGQWTKNGLSRLYRIDSAIRESMRFSNFAATLVERKVVAKEGVTNKIEGYHLPYGAFVTLNVVGVQHDADHFVAADTYDAFRYSRPREEFEARPQDQKLPDEALKFKRLGMVTTSDIHLSFGHGRHSW